MKPDMQHPANLVFTAPPQSNHSCPMQDENPIALNGTAYRRRLARLLVARGMLTHDARPAKLAAAAAVDAVRRALLANPGSMVHIRVIPDIFIRWYADQGVWGVALDDEPENRGGTREMLGLVSRLLAKHIGSAGADCTDAREIGVTLTKADGSRVNTQIHPTLSPRNSSVVRGHLVDVGMFISQPGDRGPLSCVSLPLPPLLTTISQAIQSLLPTSNAVLKFRLRVNGAGLLVYGPDPDGSVSRWHVHVMGAGVDMAASAREPGQALGPDVRERMLATLQFWMSAGRKALDRTPIMLTVEQECVEVGAGGKPFAVVKPADSYYVHLRFIVDAFFGVAVSVPVPETCGVPADSNPEEWDFL